MKERKEREPLTLTNDRIRAAQVQVIDQDGENIGVVPRYKALQLAQDHNLDLVQIADSGKEGVPVTKIMNFGKMLYEKKKKQAEAKKHQKVIQIKEIKVAPKIGEHDFVTKMRHAIEFLKDGKRVKMTIFFRGRENVNREERGKELYERIDAFLGEQEFARSILHEADSRMGSVWSRVYFLKK